VEVSSRIKAEFGNGRDYYAWHGAGLQNLPERAEERPARDYLDWHNRVIFKP
jgi:putative restriction endonuclease